MKKILTLSVLFIIGGFFFLRGQELPDEAKRYYDKGCEILKSAKIPKDYEDAIKEYKSAMALAPNFPDVYNRLGETYEKLENYQEAIDNYSKYLSFVTDNTKASELKTRLDGLENKKKSQEAKKYFDRGCAAFESAQRAEDYEDAIKEFTNAITLDPNFSESYNKLGEVYEKLEKYQEATDNFNKYLSFMTDSARISELKTKINKLEYKRDKFNRTAGKIEALMGDWYGVTMGNIVQHFKFYKEGDRIMVMADTNWRYSGGAPLIWCSPKNFPVTLEGSDIIQFSFTVLETNRTIDDLSESVIYTFKMKIVSDKLMVGTLKNENLKYNSEGEWCKILFRIPNPRIFFDSCNKYFKSFQPCDFNIDGLINYLNLF